MKTSSTNNLWIPLLIAVLLTVLYLYYRKQTKEHFEMRNDINIWNPNTDQVPKMCSSNMECETKKCTANNYCAI